MKIAHISDTHIRLKDRHDEYQIVFDRLYEKLRTEQPDRILLTGDIVHSKITLSPELVAFTTEFLVKLSEIAPVDMIVGNHDMNMSNMDRMDALTPIVHAAQIRSLFIRSHGINYMTDTKFYYIDEDDGYKIAYGVYSLLDGKDIRLRKKDKEDGFIYIALFHGVVSGCKLDNDYIFSDASTSLSTFDNFDFVMLGDIHRRQFLNDDRTAAYPGSMIQQNFGEDIEKGFLLWDIESVDKHSCKFVPVENDYAYATIYADNDDLPDLDLPPKTRIRVIWSMKSQDISRSEASRLNSLIKNKYNPYSLQLTFKPIGNIGLGDVDISKYDNLSDPDVQSDLLRQWFLNLDEPVDTDALMEIDKDVEEVVVTNNFEDFNNSKWDIKNITINNFMSYGENVYIDFESMRGVIGLFGDNTAGKSVIIDAILYSLFNKTTREVKNEDLVNKNTGDDVCRVKLQLEIRGIEYEIDRWTTRQYQKRSGRFINARTDVTFKRRYKSDDDWENLTETQRNETEKIIRNAVGSFDDFMITTLSTQGGSTEFLKMKRSPRADTMLRFLGLDVFNRKYEYAKDILKQIEGELRLYNQDNEIDMLDTKKSELKKLERENNIGVRKLSSFDDNIIKIRDDISSHTSMINRTIVIEKGVDTLSNEKDDITKMISDLTLDDKALTVKVKTLVDKMEDLETGYIFDEDKMIELVEVRNTADNIKVKIDQGVREIKVNKRVLKAYVEDIKNENACPVSDDSRHVECSYLRGYIDKKDQCSRDIDNINAMKKEVDAWKEIYGDKEYSYGVIDEQEKIRGYIEKAVVKLDKYKRELQTINNNLEVKEVSLKLTLSQLNIAENNEDIILKNKHHKKKIVELNSSLDVELDRRKKLSEKMLSLASPIVILEKEISDIDDILEKIRNSDDRRNLFNLYCGAMHRNGLPVDILKNYIPKINYEINKILSDVVEFGVYLKIDPGETDIDIVMRYDNEEDDTRPATMASGMEALLINMAIRYALISLSNLNTASSWFQDEGFGVLDVENLFSMSQFFDNVKGVFKNIIIITHIDDLKDIADWIILIEKKGGISVVNSPVKNI